MKDSELKVSIIIPVYNIENYVERCIKSVIKQSYKNLEIIVVDDGSTDNSGFICDTLKKSDERIVVIHKENGGLSSSRNEGMKIATGIYTMFVDGDDWLDINCVENCLDIVWKYNCNLDVVLFPYIREYKGMPLKNEIFDKDNIVFTKDKVRKVLLRRLFGLYRTELHYPDSIDDLSTAWGKLYRTSIIKSIEFVDTKIIGTEDAWFNINVFFKVQSAVFTKTTYYHYNKENGSALTKTYNPLFLDRWQTLYNYMQDFVRNNRLGTEYEIALNNRIIINLLAVCRNVINSNLTYSLKIAELKKILNNKLYISAFNKFSFKYMSLKWKVFYKACYFKNVIGVYFITKCAEKLKKILR